MSSVAFVLTASALAIIAIYIALRKGGYYYDEEECACDAETSRTPYELYKKENPRTSCNR